MLETQELTAQLSELEGKLAAKHAELRDLATMGAVITSIHETSAVLSVVLDMALPMAGAEVGAILMDEGGELKARVSWGIREEVVTSLIMHKGVDLATYCFANRSCVILNDLTVRDERGMFVQSCICLPIQTGTRTYGVLLLVNKIDGSSFTEEEREELEMLLNFVAVAIDNAQLMKERLSAQKVEQEIAIARQVQATILPSGIDQIKGADIGVVYHPAREVSGDVYDVVKVSENRFIVAIGDVSSKGVPAALIMSAFAGIFKTLVREKPGIGMGALTSLLNDLLAEEIIKDREMFITLCFCLFDLDTMTLTYCNAGHLPGLLWDQKNEKLYQLIVGGPIVGQFSGVKYKEETRPLRAGDKLLLYTDGVTEAADSENRLFGVERLEQAFRGGIHRRPRKFCEDLKNLLDAYAVGADDMHQDDCTIMQIEVGVE